jgi:dolichol-phosphate mannosyltransferase
VNEGPWPSLGIVVPVYDEGPGLEGAVERIAAVAGRYDGRAVVVAVDDGSSDDSLALLRSLQRRLDALDVVARPANGGYGTALRSGAERASELGLDYVAFIDSDLTNPPEDLLRIGELIAAGHPYVKGSRFVHGGGMPSVPPLRRAYSRAGNLVGRLLFGTRVRDVTNGFRAVRTDLVLSWPLREPGFAVIVEELGWALREGIEPVEFPTVLGARAGEQRPTAFTYSPDTLRSYLSHPAAAAGRRLRGRRGGSA